MNSMRIFFGLFLFLCHAQPPPPVQLEVNGTISYRASSYSFPQTPIFTLSNGLFSASFNRDDTVFSGWSGPPSITMTSLLFNGSQLAHNLNGEAPRDPDRVHSFYVDVNGGKERLQCTRVDVLRASPELVELVFVDEVSSPVRFSHHVIARRGVAGLYGFVTMSIVGDSAVNISEARFNARFDRGILDHAFSDERGLGIQPTYAFLATQRKVGDETWEINGTDAPSLPNPTTNGGGGTLPPGYLYSKYLWALYHANNTLWGHVSPSRGLGVFHVPLGGSTGTTSTASYGLGPQHQDLTVHQDALICNYFSPNHFSVTPLLALPGTTRFFGPWLTLFSGGSLNDPSALLEGARATASAEIAASRTGLPWLQHALYVPPLNRSTVTGFLELELGRSFSPFFVLLSAEWGSTSSSDPYRMRSPTYWTVCDMQGKFTIPGVPAGEGYTLVAFNRGGTVSDTFTQGGVSVPGGGGEVNLGTFTFTASDTGEIRLWHIGGADKAGGEFGLGNHSREFSLPAEVPADLVFFCDTFDFAGGQDPVTNWPYAQTQKGTWTIRFNAFQKFTGTARLVIGTSMQQGLPPTFLLNGQPFAGALSSGTDDPISRGSVKGAAAGVFVLTIDASVIVWDSYPNPGVNNLTITKGEEGGGTGWDFLFLAVPSQ